MSEMNHTADPEPSPLVVILYSFGFKHGVPVDANMLWDVRFLPNPYWQDELRAMNGLEPVVADYVVKSAEGKKFLELLEPLLLFSIRAAHANRKSALRLAIGCTGGRHRSVAVVEKLGRFLAGCDVRIRVFHRDLQRDTQLR